MKSLFSIGNIYSYFKASVYSIALMPILPTICWAAEITFIPEILTRANGTDYGINDSGQIIGLGRNQVTGQSDGTARLWSGGTTTIIANGLGGTYTIPRGINNTSVVVGEANVSGGQTAAAFLWQNGTMQSLWSNGRAYGVSSNNQVVGHAISSGISNATSWQNGVITVLPTFSPNQSGVAYSVNDSGQIAGYINAGGIDKLVRWDGSTIVDIGLKDGTGFGCPPTVNNSGNIAGTAVNPSGASYAAFYWQGTGYQIIAAPSLLTAGCDINNANQIVGVYYIYTGAHWPVPFLWQNGNTTNLNRLPNTDYSGVGLGRFNFALSINSQAQVVMRNAENKTYLLNLPPEFINKSDENSPSDEQLYGKDGSPQSPTDHPTCQGMCSYNAHTSTVSLSLVDTPVGVGSTFGPSSFVRLNYSHRTNSQPASPNFFNVGPKWTLNVLSYVQDDPANPGKSVSRYISGGGSVDYESELGRYSSSTGYFPQEVKTQAKLLRVPATGTLTRYELQFPDGSVHKYEKLDGATTKPRRVFLSKIIDPQGNALTFNYDTQLRLTNITDAANRVTTFNYTHSDPKLVTKITDPFGRFAELTYTSGKLTSIKDVIGLESKLTYDTVDTSFIKTLKTPYGTSNFAYGENATTKSRWLEMTDALGQTERLELMPNAPAVQADETSLPENIGIVNGQYNLRNTFYWDRYVLPVARPTPGGPIDYLKATITHWQRNAFGEQSAIIESIKPPHDNRIYLGYPANNYPNEAYTTNKPSDVARVLDSGATQNITIGQNVWGKPTVTFDPRKRRTARYYDATGIDLKEIWQKTTDTTETKIADYTYNTQHRVTTYKDAANRLWNNGYNAAGQLISTQNPLLQTTQYAYDSYGRPTTVTNANNVVVKQFHYPCNTSATGLVNCNLPDWIKEFDGVDVNGYQRSFVYDKFDRVTQITYPDGTTELFDYNFPSTWPAMDGIVYANKPSLDLWKYTDRMGRVTNYVYDKNRRRISVTEEATVGTTSTTRTTTYDYFANGALQQLTDANGNKTRWTIDYQSRPLTKTYAYNTPEAKTETYTYDATGRPKTVTDALGQVKTYSYNVDDTVSALTYTNHADPLYPTPNVTYGYDDYWPRLKVMTDKSGPNGALASTEFKYTPLGVDGALQLQSETNDGWYNQHMGYFYDALGRMSQRWSAESPETFTYDSLGRLATYAGDNGKSTYSYLGQSGLANSRVHIYPETNPTTTLTTTYSYDTTVNDRRLLGINHPNVGRSYSFGYGYTESGQAKTDRYNIRTETEIAPPAHPWVGQTWTYNYDKSDRLLSAVGGVAGTYDWQYDKLDNPTRAQNPSYTDFPTYNGHNQLTKFAWWQNVTHDAAGNTVADGNRTYKWDFEGRLIRIEFPNNPGYVLTYGYDGLGRRIVNKVDNQGSITQLTRVWCGERPCQLRNNTLSLRRYLLNGEYDNVSGERSLYLTDSRGSVRDFVSVLNGARIGAVDYTAYGQQRQVTGTQPHFQYAGLLWDGQAGLSFSYTRPYEAGLARWLTRDWIREAGGINMYAYTGGNPVMNVDPQGTFLLPAAGVLFLTAALLTPQPANAPTFGFTPIPPNSFAPYTNGLIAAGGLQGLVSTLVKMCVKQQIVEQNSPQQAVNPLGIPSNFKSSPTDKGGGTKYTDPNNPGNSVRDMPGNPNSSNPAQQAPYVKQLRNGQAIDVDGNPVSGKSPESHIPRGDFWYRP